MTRIRLIRPIASLAVIVVAGAFAGDAAAQTRITKLKAQAIVASDTVRLDDLVDGAGDLGATPLFRAPDLGGVGAIRSERVLEAARELGLTTVETRGLMAVMVHRPARDVVRAEVEGVLRAALARRDPALAEADLTLPAEIGALRAPRAATVALTAEIAEFDPRSGRFAARIMAGSHTLATLAGTADAMQPLAVLNRPLARGETVQSADITIEKRKRREVLPGALPADATIGLVAQRNLAAGQTLRAGDLYKPDLVEQNQAVMVAYEAPGIALALRGKAMASGGLGAVIPVQNLQSKRSFDAIITGPGKVSARLQPKP